VSEIEAIQDVRKDKQAGLKITERKIEKVRAEMFECEAAVAKTIDSRIADKEAELAAIQAELQKLEQGRKDQIAEACAEQTSELKGLTGGLKQQIWKIGKLNCLQRIKLKIIKGFEAKGNAGNFV